MSSALGAGGRMCVLHEQAETDAPWCIARLRAPGRLTPGDSADIAVRPRIGSTQRTERTMAYMLTHFWPGATEAQYRATIAKVHPSKGLPAGQSYHAAGPTAGGFLIAAIWDSKET